MSAYSDAVAVDSPLAYYPLDEASGTNANDVANNLDGTYVNSPTLGVPGPIAGQTAVQFAGDTATVTLPSGLTVPHNSSVTVEFFVKLPNLSGTHYGFRVGDVADTGRFCKAWVTYGGTLYWDFGNEASDGRIYATFPGAGVWVHVVLVSTGTANTSKKIYFNGVEAATASASAGPNAAISGGIIAFGNFVGSFAHFAVYSQVLSAARVAAHYNAAFPSFPKRLALLGVG